VAHGRNGATLGPVADRIPHVGVVRLPLANATPSLPELRAHALCGGERGTSSGAMLVLACAREGGGVSSLCARVKEAETGERIVAVIGDANRLPARRSTAARSASHLHTCGAFELQALLAKRWSIGAIEQTVRSREDATCTTIRSCAG
jgi:hypothetical protein